VAAPLTPGGPRLVAPPEAAGTPRSAEAAAAELQRRIEVDRARNQRFRERHRTTSQADQIGHNGQARRAESGGHRPGVPAPPPIHSTTPLEQLGGESTFVRAAPEADYEAEASPEVDAAGAKKFAACVSLVFRLALDDAVVRYDLGALGPELGGGLTPENVGAAKAAAVAYVFEHAERCAIKHGFGINVPYEDELVTLGAGGGGLIYLLLKYTGRLDRRSAAEPPRPVRTDGRADPPHHGISDEPDDDDFTPIRATQARDGR
jgi:hypothetical protein